MRKPVNRIRSPDGTLLDPSCDKLFFWWCEWMLRWHLVGGDSLPEETGCEVFGDEGFTGFATFQGRRVHRKRQSALGGVAAMAVETTLCQKWRHLTIKVDWVCAVGGLEGDCKSPAGEQQATQ